MAANRRARVAAVRPTDAPEWPQFRRFGDDAEKSTKSPSHFDVVFRDSRFFLKLGFLSRLVFSFRLFRAERREDGVPIDRSAATRIWSGPGHGGGSIQLPL